jgi:hypothetical protein
VPREIRLRRGSQKPTNLAHNLSAGKPMVSLQKTEHSLVVLPFIHQVLEVVSFGSQAPVDSVNQLLE